MSGALGVTIKQKDLDTLFLTVPGEELVANTMLQLASVQGQPDAKGNPTFPFQLLFGPVVVGKDQQRWADYQRFDWSIRQLPTINIFEGDVEDKSSDQAWLNGTIKFQVFWPPNQRRSDLMRVQQAFKGIMQNFFSSQYVTVMLDELYYIQRPNQKVNGLNEYGKVMTWTSNIEGLVESELVPVTSVDVKYRIDLRAWYRALDFQYRTKDLPFTKPLSDLTVIGGEYDGIPGTDVTDVEVTIDDEIEVTNP